MCVRGIKVIIGDPTLDHQRTNQQDAGGRRRRAMDEGGKDVRRKLRKAEKGRRQEATGRRQEAGGRTEGRRKKIVEAIWRARDP